MYHSFEKMFSLTQQVHEQLFPAKTHSRLITYTQFTPYTRAPSQYHALLGIFRLGHAEVKRLCSQRESSLASMENIKGGYEEPSKDLLSCNIWRRGGGIAPAVYVLSMLIILSFQRKHKSLEKKRILEEKNYELYMKLIAPGKKIDNLLDAVGLALSC